MKWFVAIVVALVTAAVTAAAVFAATMVRGFRRQDPKVVERARRFMNDVVNPKVVATAGQEGQPSLIRHRGRRTGTEYSTPIAAIPTDTGFAVVLPFGRDVAWVKNVLATGSAVLEHEGATYEVESPEIVPVSAAPLGEAEEPAQFLHVEHALLMTTKVPAVVDAANDE